MAIIGGILDYDTFDERIINSIDTAREKGIKIRFREEEAITDHPNTARIHMGDDEGEIELVGISIGEGKVEIIELNGFELKLSGHHRPFSLSMTTDLVQLQLFQILLPSTN